MSVEIIDQKLQDADLHQESVDRLTDHFQAMKLRLRQGNYEECGTHIGNFCENIVNILRDQMGEEVQTHPQIHGFVTNCLNGNLGMSEPDEIRLGLTRMLRATYDIRNNRDSVHVNLEIPVNHADTQAGVRMCSWMLSELLRVYGDGEEEMEAIATLIEELSTPTTSYIDEYRGDRLVQHDGLTVREEILVHLLDLDGTNVDIDELVSWIPNKNSRSVKRSLAHMGDDRLVWYDKEDGYARITTLGVEAAEDVVQEKI